VSRYMMNKFIRAVEMSTANVNAYVADTEGFVDGWLAGGAGPDAAADDRVLTPEERTAFVERDYGRCTVSARTPICSGTSPKRSTSTSTPRVPDGGNSWSATAPRSSRTARSTTSPDPASPRAPGAPDSRRGFVGPAAHRFRGTSVGSIRAARGPGGHLLPASVRTPDRRTAGCFRAGATDAPWVGFPRGIRPICAGVARRGERGATTSSMCGVDAAAHRRCGSPPPRTAAPPASSLRRQATSQESRTSEEEQDGGECDQSDRRRAAGHRES